MRPTLGQALREEFQLHELQGSCSLQPSSPDPKAEEPARGLHCSRQLNCSTGQELPGLPVGSLQEPELHQAAGRSWSWTQAHLGGPCWAGHLCKESAVPRPPAHSQLGLGQQEEMAHPTHLRFLPIRGLKVPFLKNINFVGLSLE